MAFDPFQRSSSKTESSDATLPSKSSSKSSSTASLLRSMGRSIGRKSNSKKSPRRGSHVPSKSTSTGSFIWQYSVEDDEDYFPPTPPLPGGPHYKTPGGGYPISGQGYPPKGRWNNPFKSKRSPFGRHPSRSLTPESNEHLAMVPYQGNADEAARDRSPSIEQDSDDGAEDEENEVPRGGSPSTSRSRSSSLSRSRSPHWRSYTPSVSASSSPSTSGPPSERSIDDNRGSANDTRKALDDLAQTLAPDKKRSRWFAFLEYKHITVSTTYDDAN